MSVSRYRMLKEETSHLERLVEIADLTKLVQESVNPRLVVLDERVERDHVSLLCVRRLVRKVLQHLGNLRGGT